jgi:hypothetical protein
MVDYIEMNYQIYMVKDRSPRVNPCVSELFIQYHKERGDNI